MLLRVARSRAKPAKEQRGDTIHQGAIDGGDSEKLSHRRGDVEPPAPTGREKFEELKAFSVTPASGIEYKWDKGDVGRQGMVLILRFLGGSVCFGARGVSNSDVEGIGGGPKAKREIGTKADSRETVWPLPLISAATALTTRSERRLRSPPAMQVRR